jgi:hypothetical protein
MNLTVTPIGRIEQYIGTPFHQPNGVALYANGRIAIADGGNDRICLFNNDATSLASVGAHGYNQYAFKEPVAVNVAPDGQLFVSDWLNHRVVVYDNKLDYVTEFGRYAPPTGTSRLYHLATFLQNLAYQGSYVERFHDNPTPGGRGRYNIRQAFAGWRYWNKRFGGRKHGWQAIFDSDQRLLKPNGVAFVGDRMAVTDKDAQALRWLAWRGSTLQQVDIWYGPGSEERFGRLGNVTSHADNSLFICDEYAHVIWRMDLVGNTIATVTGADSGTGVFLPFSSVVLDDNLLAVCGGLNFQIIDMRTNVVSYTSDPIGELHGIAWEAEKQRLFICNRSENRIDLYRVAQN